MRQNPTEDFKPISEAAKGDRVRFSYGGQTVTARVVRVKKDGTRTVELEDERYSRYGEMWIDVRPSAQENPMLEENARRRRKLTRRCQGIVSRTAASEQRKGVPQAQAVAIGYSKARRAGCKVPPPPRRLADNPVAFWGKFLG